MLNHVFDKFFAFFGILFLFPIIFIIYFLIYFDGGSPLFFQKRIGKDKKVFLLIKFRTMKKNTKSVASHLSNNEDITKTGFWLRKFKLDELPQLYNVLIGEMSLVGPRPNLENQKELISLRTKFRVYDVKPGITGLSQINNIDMSNPQLLAKTDSKMISNFSTTKYFYYIFRTIFGAGSGDAIKKK